MNENTKTISFVGVAVVLAAIGFWISIPSRPDERVEIGQPFFPDFNVAIGVENKVDLVAGAEIVEVSADTSVRRAIQVERVDGAWQINPVKQGYPDVSVDRLADVVKAVRDLKKLDISSENADDHRRYGVVDPTDAESLKAGADGVGKLVTIQDPSHSTLVKLIVGKKDDKKAGLSYVREPGRDRVYVTEIDPSALSTRFEDWVKPDLLEEADGDIRAVSIDDHAIDAEKVREMQGIFAVERNVAKPIFKSEADLKKDANDAWTFARFETFDKEKQQFVPRKLTDDEQIDSSKLFTLRGALGRVKIVDAVKKAPVLAEDLAGATNFLTDPKSKVRSDEASIRDLRLHGFVPSLKAKGSQEIELINHEGDMTVGFADGVEFTLRFGDITGRGQADPAKAAGEGAKADDGKPADAAAAEGPAAGSNTAPSRYLMVTATFNADLVPKPKLQELPPEPGTAAPAKPEEKKPEEKKPAEGAKPAEPAKSEPAKADGAPSGSCDDQEPEKKAPEKKEPEKKEPEKKEPEKKDDSAKTPALPAEAAKPTASPTATPTASPSATPTASPSATPAASPSATKPVATPSATTKPATTPAETPPVAKPAETKPMTPEERERIVAANKQFQTAYDEQIKVGREKAERLNKKFAAWFYVVSSTTYEDLNVDPTTLVTTKSAPPPPGPPGGGLPPGMNMQDLQRMIQQQQQQR